MESIEQIVKSKKHYTYALAYPDGRFFYIGKGKGKRIYGHEVEARNPQKKSSKFTTIRAIWASGCEVSKVILASFDREQDALLYEAALVFLMDGLTNVLPGGSRVGSTGITRSAEHRRRIGEANKLRRGRVMTEEHRRKLSEALKGRKSSTPKGSKRPPFSEEHRRKMSEAARGHSARGCYAYQKGHKLSEEALRKLADSRKGYSRKPLSEETKRKISEAKKRGYLERSQKGIEDQSLYCMEVR